MRLFSKYQNLSTEKSLTQQFNALSQEMDLLKMQLSKINQLLNDTITDKCKHELIYHQQIQNSLNRSQSSQLSEDTSNLFRASLVPVSSDSKTNISIKKFSSPSIANRQVLNQSNNQFNSSENLLNQSGSRQNYSKNIYQAHHHHYLLNSNKMNDNKLMSKSIDSVCSPTSSSEGSNKANSSSNNVFSAFNSINGKKLTINHQNSIDEYNKSDSFQPVNFTNSRPRQLHINVQQPSQNANFFPSKSQNFRREIISEKKRSSIGKFPQNYYVSLNFQKLKFKLIKLKINEMLTSNKNINLKTCLLKPRDYFQPIQNNQITARERLFGNGALNIQQNIIDLDSANSRKIALVKPELRGACDK